MHHWSQLGSAYFSHPPAATGVLTHASQSLWSSRKDRQQAAHTLHPGRNVLHAVVPLSWPQLNGAVQWQPAMHSPGVCVPRGSAVHCPELTLQRNITGVGTGVGAAGGGGGRGGGGQ
jgi:hypothetical protein